MKKKLSLALVALLTLTSTITPVHSIDYSEDENYWYETCNGTITSDLLSACRGFNDYLVNKAKDMEDNLEDLDKQIEEIKNDISKLVKIVQETQEEIDEKEIQIKKLEIQISTLESKIKKLEEEIVIREEDIERRDNQIRERMVKSQTYNKTHGYINFIMGASDFIDMIRRISVMNQLTAYEHEQIQLLNDDIKQLEHDKQELELTKESLDVQKSILDKEKTNLVQYKKRQEKLITQYKQKEEDLVDAYMRSEESISQIRNNMPSFSVKDPSNLGSSGFGKVVDGYVSAGTWHYPVSFGGARHSGLDIAGPQGTPIYASFSGVVAIAQNVTDKGGLGVRPYTGNNVMIIGQVNGNTYAIHMLHMQYNSITVKVGDVVSQGQVIGARGTTGNSTGPHTHIDLYNLGSMSVEDAYNYVKRTGTYTFGMPYKANGWECSNKSPVCKERPEDKIPH